MQRDCPMAVVQLSHRSELLPSLVAHIWRGGGRKEEWWVGLTSGLADQIFPHHRSTHADDGGDEEQHQSCDMKQDDSQEQQQHPGQRHSQCVCVCARHGCVAACSIYSHTTLHHSDVFLFTGDVLSKLTSLSFF